MAARKLKPRHQEEIKLKIQTTQLVNFLQKHALNENENKIDPTRIKAAEILLARSLPTLSAVEQSTVEPDQKLTEADILTKIRALISAHPELVQQVIADQARESGGISQCNNRDAA